MAYPEEGVVQTWLDALKELNIRVRKCSAVTACTVTVSRWAG